MKKIIIAVIVLVVIVAGYFIIKSFSGGSATPSGTMPDVSTNDSQTPVEPAPTTPRTPVHGDTTVIGTSVQGRDIVAYHYGAGEKELLFIGGIHGGYEWNTVLVAREAMDYFKANPEIIPDAVRVTVIPLLNPDGLNKVIGTSTLEFTSKDVSKSTAVVESGRFNANNVDLNRNFDCDWKAEAKWQNKDVSGGTAPFSEPETQAIKNYVEKSTPTAIVTWYSAAGGVFASNCYGGVLDETKAITKVFADASKYRAYDNFDFYEITGDMVNWFAKMKIPAISVLLTNHTDTEWTKNQAGIKALLMHYAK